MTVLELGSSMDTLGDGQHFTKEDITPDHARFTTTSFMTHTVMVPFITGKFSVRLDNHSTVTTIAKVFYSPTTRDKTDSHLQLGIGITSFLSIIMQMIAFLPCIIGNILVFIVMVKEKSLQSNTNRLILSLAIADTMVGLVVIPIQVLLLIPNANYQTDVFCLIHRFLVTFPLGCSLVSMLLLSIDRYLALVHPFAYTERVTSRTVRLSIMGSWLLMLILTSPIFVSFTVNNEKIDEEEKSQCGTAGIQPRPYGKALYFVLLMIFLLNIGLNVLVAKIALGHYRQISSNSLTSDNQRRADIHSTKLMVAMFGFFIVLWTPYFIIIGLFIFDTCNGSCSRCNEALQIFLSLGVINSASNCYIYAWRKQDFQFAIRRIIARNQRRHIAQLEQVSSVRMIQTSRSVGQLADLHSALSAQQIKLQTVTIAGTASLESQSNYSVTWDLSETTDQDSRVEDITTPANASEIMTVTNGTVSDQALTT